MSDFIPLDPVGEETPKSERRDAAANRERILTIAQGLFDEHGVANVHMADIAKAAGVGKGTLYRRFANKGELCLALMDGQFKDFQNVMLGRFRHLTGTNVSYLDQTEQFIDALVQFSESHSAYLCEVQQLERDSPQDFGRPHYWNEMTIQGLLQQAAAGGEIPADSDIPMIANMILAPLNAANFRFLRLGRGFSLEQVSQGMRYIIAGLRVGLG